MDEIRLGNLVSVNTDGPLAFGIVIDIDDTHLDGVVRHPSYLVTGTRYGTKRWFYGARCNRIAPDHPWYEEQRANCERVAEIWNKA